jgi:hypothetical protein
MLRTQPSALNRHASACGQTLHSTPPPLRRTLYRAAITWSGFQLLPIIECAIPGVHLSFEIVIEAIGRTSMPSLRSSAVKSGADGRIT